MTDTDFGAFLSGPSHPEQDALLRAIGALIIDPQGVDGDAADTGREWSDERDPSLISRNLAPSAPRPDDHVGLRPLIEREARLATLLSGVAPPRHYSDYHRGLGASARLSIEGRRPGH